MPSWIWTHHLLLVHTLGGLDNKLHDLLVAVEALGEALLLRVRETA